MPTYLITAPDGRKFEVTGEGSADDALRVVQEGLASREKGASAPGEPTVAGKVQDAKKNAVADVMRGGLAGVGQGAEMMVGLPGDIASAGTFVGRHLNRFGRMVLGMEPRTAEDEATSAKRAREWMPLPTTADVAGFVDKYAPSIGEAVNYQPETRLGKFARTAGTFAASALPFGGMRAVVASVPSAIGSEALGQLTEGSGIEPYARVAGAVLGPMAARGARRLVTPNTIPAERQAAVNTLHNEGVTDLTAGQITGGNKLRYTESELGGARGEAMMRSQGEQFTAAALRRAGINAPRATADVIDDAFTRIGAEFDNFAANNNVAVDATARRAVQRAVGDYLSNTSPGVRPPIVEEIGNGLQQIRGTISGRTYNSIRSLIGKRVEILRTSNPEAANALREMQDALDDALQRSVAATNPGAVRAIQEARRQYRNMLVIERAATGGGEAAASGIISPAHLRQAVKSVLKLRSFSRGRNDFTALANAGEVIMKPLPNSGTASRLGARRILESSGPAGIGALAGLGASGGDTNVAVAGALAGALIPWGAGRALLSRPSRAYLTNQLLPPVPRLPRTAGELAAAINAMSTPLRLPSPQPSR